MGIAVRDILALEYIKNFKVIAGRGGLHREIQGITCFEAPDGYRWGRGKELALSSGYVIAKEPDCIRKGFEEGWIQMMSGMIIKRGRYLESIPEELLRLFDEHDVPLITMPYELPWMELMSQVNTAVMNRTIRRFNIQNTDMFQPAKQTYKVHKIKKILQAVEMEMKFPALLYDLQEERSYYSSTNFKRITASFGLKDTDYLEPTQPFTNHTLCDYIDMVRYRLVNPPSEQGARVSWIRIPIVINQVVQAYFVVMESKEFIDYYDEYAIRIAFLMLQAVYEQAEIARNVGNAGFENFIHFALNHKGGGKKQLDYQAKIQGISLSSSFIYVVFRQRSQGLSTFAERKKLLEAFASADPARRGKLVLLDENEGALLFKTGEPSAKDRRYVSEVLESFMGLAERACPGIDLVFGVCWEGRSLIEVREYIGKCRKVLEMGKILYPTRRVWDYDMLGPLAWLQIPEEELENMLREYRELMKDERNAELLRTLKIYLENNMNYSLTAEKMYVHINTIRKRIEKIDHLLDIRWNQYIDRLRVELLLQFLEL